MKVLRLVGLTLFLVGLAAFNLTFFLNEYRLTESQVKQIISSSEKAATFSNYTAGLLNKTYSSNFQFISDLDQVFESINQTQLQRFSVRPDEIDLIVQQQEQAPFQFTLISLEATFGNGSEEDKYKIQAFKDYGGWMDGREYGSEDELNSHLNDVANNIKQYGIISQKGFDRYEVKALKYSLAKEASTGPVKNHPVLFIFLSFGFCIVGALLFILPKVYELPGIKNNRIFHDPMKTARWLGIMTGSYLILFYIVLYYFPQYMTGWVIMVDPISQFLKGSEAGPFFLYGFMYTLCILVMGVRMLIKYRHSKYQIIRTFSVMFFQTAFAFVIPEIMLRLNQPYFDFKNIWPLDYDFFFDSEINTLLQSGGLGVFMLVWGIALIVIAVPVFV